MGQPPKTFIGFLFSLKNIAWTIIINFVAVAFYYQVFVNGLESFYVGTGWVVVITMFITVIVVLYWLNAYKTYCAKYKNQSTGLR